MHKITAWLLVAGLILGLTPQSYGWWVSQDRKPWQTALLESNIPSQMESRSQLIQDTITTYNHRLDHATQKWIIHEILQASESSELDPFLITAVIATESSFCPHAVSPCGARGLMQLTRILQPSLGVSNPYDISQNIQGGSRFLADLYRQFGDTTLALAAYNSGPTRVARLKRVPRIPETQRYVVKVQWITATLFNRLLSTIAASPSNPMTFLARLTQAKLSDTIGNPLSLMATHSLISINSKGCNSIFYRSFQLALPARDLKNTPQDSSFAKPLHGFENAPHSLTCYASFASPRDA